MIHTQSGGGVIVNPDGKIAIASQHGKSWSLPKGHIEEGEDALTAAKREIEEETGITDLTFIKELGSYSRYRIGKDGDEDQSEQKTIYLFLFTTNQLVLSPKDPHNPEARWVEKNKVAGYLTHSKDKGFFLKTISEL